MNTYQRNACLSCIRIVICKIQYTSKTADKYHSPSVKRLHLFTEFKMAKIKLIYLNAKGRAEVIRLVLAQAGVEYEDYRFEREQWPEIKKSGIVLKDHLIFCN